ncbi:conserved hypothetical protein [Methanococcus vannielii SB]|uniref:S-layer domain-like protein n=1 Tax=Methanococcus vannielii (strain ATCC 35089 / DSM 1224 / JCM 13029 / OCM 148 / SB) TaxID=406327 RepID=A6USU7_METVS|nr:COG1361 S-layer family protein [Methanococcus vannielii]ABR55569.1 conserved hypothetical protein [Methanococcus vannielii SB]
MNYFKTGSVILILLFSITGNFTYTFYGDVNDYVILNINKVNQDPDPAISGETFDLRVRVENNGGKGEGEFIIEIDPTYPFKLVEGESKTQNIGIINGYEDGNDAIIAKFRLRVSEDAIAGDYPINVRLYKKGEDSSLGYTKEITITVGTKESAEVRINIDEIIPGEKTEVTFTVKNTGSAPIKNLEFSWTSENNALLPLGSGNIKTISYIGVSESQNLTYNVLASTNVNPGVYELSINLKYDDSLKNSNSVETHIAGVSILGRTDFDVAYYGKSGSEYSFTVMNIGKSSASSVIASIPKQDGWTVTGSSSSIIGNLDNGDYTFSNFELVKIQNTELPLLVDITYTDFEGNRIIVQKEVSIYLNSFFESDNTKNIEDNVRNKGRTTPLQGIKDSVYKLISYVVVIISIIVSVVLGRFYLISKKKEIIKNR